jgi:pimeloyl-ACP methyl ester carboxylesterase
MARSNFVLKLATWCAGAVLLLAAAGLMYERSRERRDRQQFPQIGRSIDVGGRTLNVFCSGEGRPTVILDSGRGMPGYSWLLVQPEVATVTRACWYDRAGYGWSDPAPAAQDIESIAADLHVLLQMAGETPPFLVVGHSFGGLIARLYYARYPDEMAGMVLVEPSHEDLNKLPNPTNVGAPLVRLPPSVFPVARRFAQALAPFGLFRLVSLPLGAPPAGISPEAWATIARLRRQPKSQLVQEGSAATNFDIIRRAGKLGDLPLTVLAAGKPPRAADPTAAKAFQEAWIDLLGGLARMSTRGQHRVIMTSGHMIPFEAPEAIVDAITEIVNEVRGATPTQRRSQAR